MSQNPLLTQQLSDSHMADLRRATSRRRGEFPTVAGHGVLGAGARVTRPLTRWLHV